MTTWQNKSRWIQTFTGKALWPADPNPKDIDIRDVAHALSMICRYTGHVREFLSVAQHSVMASEIVPQADAQWGLMHDASEAYLADIARPVKPLLTNYKHLEERLMMAVAIRFGLQWPMPDSIHLADRILLATERRDLMTPPPQPWSATVGIDPLSDRIEPWSPAEAERRFLSRFAELFPQGARQDDCQKLASIPAGV